MFSAIHVRGAPFVRALVALTLASTFLIGVHGAQARTDPGFTVGQAVVVDTDALNFRASATTSAAVVATLIDGTYATVTGGPTTADGYVWYKLDVDGVAGWSAADYLSPASGAHGLLPAGVTAIVTTDALNLRATPSLTGDIVTTMVTGDRPAVVSGPQTAGGHDWYELTFNGETGWAVRDYLAFAPQAVSLIAVGDVAMVNTDTLNLRKDASASANVIAVLNGGAFVTVLSGPTSADGIDWVQVDTGAQTGWVAAEYLTI